MGALRQIFATTLPSESGIPRLQLLGMAT